MPKFGVQNVIPNQDLLRNGGLRSSSFYRSASVDLTNDKFFNLIVVFVMRSSPLLTVQKWKEFRVVGTSFTLKNFLIGRNTKTKVPVTMRTGFIDE